MSANLPWINDREPADSPPYSRILDGSQTTAFMPIIGRPLAAGQASPTLIQVRNLLVEDHVLNGQSVVATLLLEPINAISLRARVTVSLEFPAGVEYVAGSMSQPPGASAQISYNVATRRLTVGNIQLNLGGQTAYPYRLAVNALTAPINREIRIQTTASAQYAFQVESSVLRIGRPTASQTISPNGGTYALGEGRVTLIFPPGAVTHTTVITGIEYADRPVPAGQTGHAVLFEVFPALTFRQPVTVQVDLHGLVITDALTAGQWPRLDSVYAEAITQVGAGGVTTTTTQRRDEVPTTFDATTGVLTAQLTHFSTYEAGVNHTAPAPWKFETNLGSVSGFRGAATVGYAFRVPPMQDGLQPALSVQYSSAAAEQGSVNSTGPGSDGPGLGWSFDSPQITRRVKLESEDEASYYESVVDGVRTSAWHHQPRYIGRYVNDFSLSLGGSQYWLVPTDTPGEYVTENYALLRVRRCNDATPCTGADGVAGVLNDTGEFWQVWTPDGTRYVFGATPDSEELFPVAETAAIGTAGYAGRIPNQVASAWQLSAVYARHRDDPATGRASVTYRYHNFAVELGIEHTLLAEVWYGSSLTPQGAVRSGHQGYHVIVDYVQRGNKQIQPVYVRVATGKTHELLRRYALDYNAQYDLAGVREEVWNGGAYVSLPAMQFGYGRPSDRWLLSEVSNGYGGRQRFSYERIGPISYRVIQLDIDTGLGWASQTQYAYGEPCYNRAGSGCRCGPARTR